MCLVLSRCKRTKSHAIASKQAQPPSEMTLQADVQRKNVSPVLSAHCWTHFLIQSSEDISETYANAVNSCTVDGCGGVGSQLSQAAMHCFVRHITFASMIGMHTDVVLEQQCVIQENRIKACFSLCMDKADRAMCFVWVGSSFLPVHVQVNCHIGAGSVTVGLHASCLIYQHELTTTQWTGSPQAEANLDIKTHMLREP